MSHAEFAFVLLLDVGGGLGKTLLKSHLAYIIFLDKLILLAMWWYVIVGRLNTYMIDIADTL